MQGFLKIIMGRFLEGSSWAGLAGLLLSLFGGGGLDLSGGLGGIFTQVGTYGALASAIAIGLPENKA